MCTFRKNLELKKICKILYEPLYVFLIITALLVVLIVVLISYFEIQINIDALFSVLIGAFVGAGAAFFLHTSHSNKKLRLKNRASLVKTKYSINKISLINKQIEKHIIQYKNHNGDFFAWEKISEYDLSFFLPKIDMENLLFLLDDGKIGEETLDSIFLVYAENQELINVLEKRNQYYSSYLDRTENRDSFPKEKLENIIGSKLFYRLGEQTQRLIELNSNILKDCSKTENKINNFLKDY